MQEHTVYHPYIFPKKKEFSRIDYNKKWNSRERTIRDTRKHC